MRFVTDYPDERRLPGDEPAREEGVVLLDEGGQPQGYVDRRAVGDPPMGTGDHPGDERAVELVGHALVEQVTQEMGPALGELVTETAQDQLVLEPAEVDP